jgi:imidazolonepropionase-like amidohydrolase
MNLRLGIFVAQLIGPPSPLNGEKAGVRGEKPGSRSNTNEVRFETSHPSPFIPLPVEGRGKSVSLPVTVRYRVKKSNLVLLALGASLLIATTAQAETLLLTGATVHTVSGETLSPGQVLVKDGKISAVGKTVSAVDAKTVDLAGLHLYPGMIALNTELGLVEIEAVRATRDGREVGDYTPDVESWIAVNPDSELLPVARANGVSHFEPVPSGGVVSGQSGLVALDGWTVEQMTIKKPLAMHVFWPEMDLDTTPRERARNRSAWKSLDDQAKERREKLKSLDDFFQEARAFAKAREATKNGAPDPGRNPPWEAMLPVLRGEIPITVHADEVRQIRTAVKWAETNGFKIILAGGRDAWKVAGLLATNRVPVIYDGTFTQPTRDTDSYDVQFCAPATLQKAGVTVAFAVGSRSGSLAKNLPYEAAQAVAYGLPADEALKGITLYPAQIAGVADRLGSIEAGKEATLFAADGDILDIRANVKRMWIAGREVSLDNRHTRLYEKYKGRPQAR